MRSSPQPGEKVGKACAKRAEQLTDRQDRKTAAEVGGKLLGVFQGIGRTVRRRQSHPEDIVRAQGLDGDGRGQGRIDAARQAEHRRGKAAFTDIIPDPHDQSLIHRLLLRLLYRPVHLALPGAGVDDDHVLGKALGLGDDRCRFYP